MGFNASLITYRSSLHFRALPPLSLYVHIPWCARKCPYCDFNSHEAPASVPEQEYIAALTADLENALPLVWGRRIYSVFFGGGTPSLFSPQSIESILSTIRARLPLVPDAEITLEANPGTVEAEKFRAFRAAGVNRLSIGVQSFNPRHLQALGRIHGDVEARRAIDLAREHFENFNLDLMYALPGQTLEEARADIEAAISCAPAHISAYHLTIEPNTYFHRFPPRLPDDDIAAAMQDTVENLLTCGGYEHYEISAFAKRAGRVSNDPGKAESRIAPGETMVTTVCRHNLNYWKFGDYLGIGAGAHSKLSFPDRIVRQMRYKQPKQFVESAVAGGSVQTEQEVTSNEVGFEFMMNALRLTRGFDVNLFAERTGLQLNAVLAELEEAERRGLVVRDHLRIAPTALGRQFLNDLLQIFLPAPAKAKRSTGA